MKPSFSWVRKRQTKYGAYLVTYVLVVLALLVVANWAANRHLTKTWDLTSGQRFSLSDQTRKMVRGLDRDVKIYYLDRQGSFTRAKDLLDNYQRLSKRLSVEYVDPVRQPSVARQVTGKPDSIALGTIILTAGNRKQEANVLDEESITNALIRLLKTGSKGVCLVEGHGELDPDGTDRQGFSRAKKALEDSHYTVKSISLLREAKVPADCAVVVVAGPKTDYVEPEVEALRKYVEGGGSALFLVDPGTSEKLTELLKAWNVELKKDLVVDLNPVNQLFGADVTMPIITQYKSHIITRELTRVATLMPFARSVQPGKDSKSGVTIETLFETSSESWATEFNPEMKTVALRRDKDPKGPIPIAVAGTVKKSDGSQAGGGGETKAAEGAESKEGRFVVVGSSRFPANVYLGFGGNRDLFVNTANWLSSDEDLISVRPKPPENRRVNLTVAQMRWVFYGSVIGLPLVMVASGVAVWWRRRYA